MKFALSSFFALAVLLSGQAQASSDLACTTHQSQDQVQGNIAALLSRGYLAAGYKYGDGVGGFNGIGEAPSYVEDMWIGENLKLVHTVVGGSESFSLDAGALIKTKQQLIEALQKDSAKAAETLSAEDATALENCDQLLHSLDQF